jgi:phospholipase C
MHERTGTYPASNNMNNRSPKRLFRVLARTLAIVGIVAARTFAQGLPAPDASGIDHVIVVTMENRSFDHMLGWLPHADGRQEALTFVDDAGISHETWRLAPDYQGCSYSDPDHSYEGGRIEFDNGACDGWLRAGDNDEYSIGFYKRNDLKFFARAATDWTVCDRYFASIMAETWPNKIYQYAAQTDRLDNTFELCTLPTILDRLAGAGVSARYYFSDVPFLGLWGLQYLPIARPFGVFLADAAAGTLPAVSFIDPRFIDGASGTSADDHPHADIRKGQAFMERIYRAVTTSPDWAHTVLVFTYDEWGGFFDHVPPPLREIPVADQLAGNDGRLGFRVPCIVVSPFARARISSIELEHTSVLRMIEWRWNLEPLTVRDATANNLAEVLDFSANRLHAPQYSVPQGPFAGACPGVVGGGDKWAVLLFQLVSLGWPF